MFLVQDIMDCITTNFYQCSKAQAVSMSYLECFIPLLFRPTKSAKVWGRRVEKPSAWATVVFSVFSTIQGKIMTNTFQAWWNTLLPHGYVVWHWASLSTVSALTAMCEAHFVCALALGGKTPPLCESSYILIPTPSSHLIHPQSD